VTYTFSGGVLLSLLMMTVLIALPVKIAALFADAKRTGILWCFGAVAVGLVIGSVTSFLVGGYIGGPLAGFLGFVMGMRLMLGTSFAAALGLSIIAFGLSLAGFALLVKLGVIVAGHSVAVIAT
jgi:hypothetical protein